MKAYVITPPAEQTVIGRAMEAVGLASPGEVVELPDADMMMEIARLLEVSVNQVEGAPIYEFGDYVFHVRGDTSGKVVVVGKNQYGEWTQPEAGEEDMVRMLRDKASEPGGTAA